MAHLPKKVPLKPAVSAVPMQTFEEVLCECEVDLTQVQLNLINCQSIFNIVTTARIYQIGYSLIFFI